MREVTDASEPWKSFCLQQLVRVYGGGEKGMEYRFCTWYSGDIEDYFYPGTTLWVPTNTLRHLNELGTEDYKIVSCRQLSDGLVFLVAWKRK